MYIHGPMHFSSARSRTGSSDCPINSKPKASTRLKIILSPTYTWPSIKESPLKKHLKDSAQHRQNRLKNPLKYRPKSTNLT
ncbi:hypothetical protein F511_35338 [Dorcoceras hygrometricum]|uniref:Uncharacterized protein n=1 Tax=Dorcoceras hygrometricum TaxID=472368 RepID=A0A2Z7CN84_9LAMI|nr:hypothetical protein F511_35338 [Dorcoceras hygrometricum]